MPLFTPPDSIAAIGPLAPTGAIAETFSRMGATLSNTLANLSTGRLHLVAIPIDGGQPINNTTFFFGSTAGATMTNWWFSLHDASRNLLRQTADQTTGAISASQISTLALTSTYTTLSTGLFYLGIMVKATTMPTLSGLNTLAVVTGAVPILSGASTSTLTTTAPNPAAAITALGQTPYAYVS